MFNVTETNTLHFSKQVIMELRSRTSAGGQVFVLAQGFTVIRALRFRVKG